ncbi:MAG: septal ring lytic transglycosylase RlpA family protein [Treponema sp.]|jgi:rare lipoprotein A|nr:septal ring lytic transglycosylase RlpA family protein [Treponema sp.]
MKRLTLAVPGLFLAVGLCMAQSWQARHQIGTATQEMRAEGLSAAHSRIPVGSKAKITNPANGLEIEVTVIGVIPESPNRIIDLSPTAARALDIGPGGPVIVASLNQNIPQNTPENSSGPASDVEVQAGKQPFYITINNYIINPDKPVSPEEDEKKPPDTAETPNVETKTSSAPVTQPPEEPPGKTPLFTAQPVNDPQIIPGLPNPNTDKIYRLMVGTYVGVDSAFRIHQQLQAAGFEVAQEQSGEMCKVFAAGIPASRVYYAVKRLGAIGFQQIWVQE